MREKVYVDRLFADYEDTPEIKDFKEEITANLTERVRGLAAKGLSEEKAFEKAAAELGDITAIADEVGKKKRNEAIGQMYINAKVPITKKTAAGITVASALLLLAIALALIAYFSETASAVLYYISAASLSLACGTYIYFGLTQESAAHYAMKTGRAIAYGIICLVGFLGASLAVATYLFDGFEMSGALIIKAVFILPAICALIFMLATEPKRQKPWLRALTEQGAEKAERFFHDTVDPAKAARFGVTSGGLWLLAIAIFAALGFLIGWQYAWIVFLFALAVQVFMVTMIFEKKK